MQSRPSILVVDDDPTHLRIYGWIMKAAGFRAVTAQAMAAGVCLPDDETFDIVVLDYRLTGALTAVEAAQQIQRKYPVAPIVILSDNFGMPEDIEPYATQFVRKGDPEKLITAICSLLPPEKAEAARAESSSSKRGVVA